MLKHCAKSRYLLGLGFTLTYESEKYWDFGHFLGHKENLIILGQTSSDSYHLMETVNLKSDI